MTDEIRDLVQWITDTINLHCPTLLIRRGVGPGNAAALLIAAGDNTNRLRSQSSFAALCGVSPWKHPQARPVVAAWTAAATAKPIPCSIASLYRGDARDYLARRTIKGKTHRRNHPCLKRYIARETYQIITPPPEAKPAVA